MSETADLLKAEVKAFWNRQSCDTDQAKSEKYSRAYFEEIEQWRYREQPFIHAFAQFTRYRGKRVAVIGRGQSACESAALRKFHRAPAGVIPTKGLPRSAGTRRPSDTRTSSSRFGSTVTES